MAENKTRRMCFNLNGLLGGILATLLLLGILGYLVLWSIEVQKANATNFYELENPSAIQMNSTDNASHWKNK
jgi:hypothetical protein